MESPAAPREPMAFVLRVERGERGVRGQLVAVRTGQTRLFDDLRDAVAFIEAALEELVEEGSA